MITNNRTQLLRNGYAVNAAGTIECRRGEHLTLERHRHSHLACIRLTVDTKAAAELIPAVVAAVSDEPGTVLTGTNKTDVLLLFRAGSSNVEVREGTNTVHPFVYRDAAGLFFATADAEVNTMGAIRVSTAFNVGDWSWKDGLSPLNTPHWALAPLYADVARRAYEAVGEYLREKSGRWGPLVVPPTPFELRLQASRAERAAKLAAGITDEDEEELADKKIVAAHPNARITDGIHGVLVDEARKRVAARKAAARAESDRLRQDEKDAKARAKRMADHLKQTA